MHFLPSAESRTLVSVEPLPMVPASDLRVPEPLRATVARCQEATDEHVQGKGEETGLEAQRFGFAALYNVLDHVHDPPAMLREIHRILRADGLFLLGCDVFSVLGLVRLRAYANRRFRDRIFVRAHPFRFRATGLVSLLRETGFTVLAHTRPRPYWLHELAAGERRILFLCARSQISPGSPGTTPR
jgi:SAM-dependent methyltransferase